MDMQAMQQFADQHKKPIVAGMIMLVVFIAFSAVMFSHTQSVQQRTAAEQSQQSTEAASDEQAAALAKLSDDQSKRQDKYTQEMKDFVSILSSNVWATDSKTNIVSFTDRTFTERTNDGKSDTTAFVVDIVDSETAQGEDTGITTNYTAAIETADDSFFMRLTKIENGEGAPTYTLSCDYFAAATSSYSPIEPDPSIEVNGLNQEVLQLVNDQEDELKHALRLYCSQYMPGVKSMNWTQTVQISWSDNCIYIPFATDKSSSKTIVAKYDRTSKVFTAGTEASIIDKK